MNKIIFPICFSLVMLAFIPPNDAQANWEFDSSRNSIISIYKSEDSYGWHAYIIAEVTNSSAKFTALVSSKEYRKIFTNNPNAYIQLNGTKLVPHETFFWGKTGDAVPIEIDRTSVIGFKKAKHNDYQILFNGNYDALIEKLKKGHTLTIRKHFFKKNGQKAYPTFSLIGFTKNYSTAVDKLTNTPSKTFPISGLMCKQNGMRKRVWINTSHGSYALNGSAISWVQTAKTSGYELIGSDGNPFKIGRDYISSPLLTKLISTGLQHCN